MEQIVERTGTSASRPVRAEVVAETLALLRDAGEGPEELAHDARNMVTALELYCHLLEEPGVLSAQFRHYGNELRLVAAASRRLLEKLSEFDLPEALEGAAARRRAQRNGANRTPMDPNGPAPAWDTIAAEPIEDLALELAAKRNLLSALAGPGVALTVDIRGAGLPVRLTREDLTRVLVNLVKNASEAMPAGGRLNLSLDEFHADAGGGTWLVLKLEDTGPGIAANDIEAIFHAGYTTRSGPGVQGWRNPRRGLGLSITRSILEAAGGRIYAANRASGGARFEIELPVLTQELYGARSVESHPIHRPQPPEQA